MSCFVERQSERFSDFARIVVPEICSLPGVLDDISREGCKVHFPLTLTIDMENDYAVVVTPSVSVGEKNFSLVCHPCWSKVDNGATSVGFQILPSRDYAQFLEYIDVISKEFAVESQIVGSICRFV